MRGAGRYWKNERGAAAAEFALVVIPFLGLVLGIIWVSMMLYANHTLQYAAEDAARCWSIKTTICTSAATTQTYASGRYSGPNIAPAFVATQVSCGHKVTGTANFPLTTGLLNTTVPLSATACFP
jgi:Flp pilus assembly protein TadG